MNTKLSKDKIMQIILIAVVIILAVVIMILVKGRNKSETPFTLTQNGEVVIDENAQKTGGEAAKTGETGTKTTTATAVTTTTTTPATTTVSGCKPGLSGKKSQMPLAIILSWTACSNSDDFQFYKLVKSQTNSSPSYPNDGAVMSSTNIKVTDYVDKTVAHPKTYYYRVCVVQRLSKTTCGNAVAVTY